jgi:uncharacterized protein (TIGR02996 family)
MQGPRAAFLEAIRAAPDDDGPRLVFADWLDERGETEHAELIRAQCRLGQLPKRSAAARRLAGRARELERLLVERIAPPPGVALRWARGFVDRVTTGVLDYPDFAGRLAPYAPAVELALVHTPDDDDERDGPYERFAACRACRTASPSTSPAAASGLAGCG